MQRPDERKYLAPKLAFAWMAALLLTAVSGLIGPLHAEPAAKDIVAGLRSFYARTARADGSFQPGVDPEYRGMSDSAYSDLAAVTYAVTLHKTFGWKLPQEAKTVAFLLSRQRPTGEFVNIAGTVRPESAEGKTYNTTQALVALQALGVEPTYDPSPVFEEILKEDYKELPAYTTSFFPLAYLCMGRPIPKKADEGVRALMIQDRTGYLNDHIAATFHASHYYHLVDEPTPKAQEMLDRIIADQSRDGSWFLNKPSRDRHATFDAVFTLRHEGADRQDCIQAIERAANWAVSCRNDDGGFGHFPGSTSDADAIYFHVGTLVMAGVLKPTDPLPRNAHLLSWGHLMPIRSKKGEREVFRGRHEGWVGGVAFVPGDHAVLAGSADGEIRQWSLKGELMFTKKTSSSVGAVACGHTNTHWAFGTYDGLIQGNQRLAIKGHRGAVLALAYHPQDAYLASGGMDGHVYLWNLPSGTLHKQLVGHRSWVNSLAFAADGTLISGSSDGTIKIWNAMEGKLLRTIDATPAEVRCVGVSRDQRWLAAGIRYGEIRTWDMTTWEEHLSFKGHESDVWSLAFTPDSNTLITGNGDWNRPGLIKMWDAKTGALTDTLRHTGEVLSLAVSRDGRYLAAGAGDKSVRVWHLER